MKNHEKPREPRTYNTHGRYNFKPHEIQEMKNSIPPAIAKIAQWEGEIASLKNQIKQLQTSIDALANTNTDNANLINAGLTGKSQPTYRLKNWDKQCFQFFTVEDQRMISETKFGPDDNQIQIVDTGDLLEVTQEDADRLGYTTLYWEGKLYNFGATREVPQTLDEAVRGAIQDLKTDMEAEGISFEVFEAKPSVETKGLPIAEQFQAASDAFNAGKVIRIGGDDDKPKK